MAQGGKNSITLWRAMVIAVICWVSIAGLGRNSAADNEEAYKGLKIFSEVIDIIEKNYVEETDERDLIRDGDPWSLDSGLWARSFGWEEGSLRSLSKALEAVVGEVQGHVSRTGPVTATHIGA